MTIETPRELQTHLQSAIEVELSTIPPYLYAMYSIEETTSESYKLVRSVVVEEMLHLSLAANVLVAVGGTPRFYDEDLFPSFPTPLPHRKPDLLLTLERCTPDVVDRVFTTVERPQTVEGLPEDASYESVGQFYRTIERAIDRLSDQYPLFQTCRVESQMKDPEYYRPVEYTFEESGGLHFVEDLATAKRAIDTVIHQGEGLHDEQYADHEHKEMTHYYKFKRIAEGDVPVGETRPVVENPTVDDLPESLRPVAELFDASYCFMFLLLEDVYSPVDEKTKARLVGDMYSLMMGVLRPLARYLTDQAISQDPVKHAGPTFEFYDFDRTTPPVEQVRDRCAGVVDEHPELEQVSRVLGRIGGMNSPLSRRRVSSRRSD